MVQTKCKLNNAEVFLRCSIFRAKKFETKSTTKKQENLKNGKVRFCLIARVRKRSTEY